MKNMKRSIALIAAIALMLGCAIVGTVAWLTAESTTVTNTFTESGIEITLTENNPADKTAKMVPGWTIDKDPTVMVTEGSEDCWLFVKITESTTPDLDDYIAYAIAEGWQTVQAEDATGVTVIGRKVYKTDATKSFEILGANSYTDPMDPNDENDNYTISWGANEVCVKPSVTKDMMDDISTNKPTLTFDAYAVQLFKTNNDGDNSNTSDEFTAAEAWARVGN